MRMWDWPLADEGRRKRAKTVKFSRYDSNSEDPSGHAVGSGSEEYAVTLYSCTCPDFIISKNKAGEYQPCKHMIALAMKCGLLNENGLTAEQQKETDIVESRNILASAFGYYYLFQDPIISDAQYDAIKQRYNFLVQTDRPIE